MNIVISYRRSDCEVIAGRIRDRLVARFNGKEGAETLGVGKGNGTNLYDPDRRAKRVEDYFFRNHGTTSCEVFVGGRKGGAKPKP